MTMFNEYVIGKHPAVSGYTLEFFVEGSENLGFQSGSGSFVVESPTFAITGLEFEGKNLLYKPTGEDLKLSADVEILEEEIRLVCKISGDLNGFTGIAKQNIKFLDVYTGLSETFTPDVINFTNRVASEGASIAPDFETYSVTISSEQIDDRVEEILFYRVVPKDFLSFQNASTGVSGEMFEGLGDFLRIVETGVTISREEATDVIIAASDQITDIFTGTTITLGDDCVLDFVADFRVRQNTQPIVIQTTGTSELKCTIDGISVVSNAVTIPAGNEFFEFEIASLMSVDENREAFIVQEV